VGGDIEENKSDEVLKKAVAHHDQQRLEGMEEGGAQPTGGNSSEPFPDHLLGSKRKEKREGLPFCSAASWKKRRKRSFLCARWKKREFDLWEGKSGGISLSQEKERERRNEKEFSSQIKDAD